MGGWSGGSSESAMLIDASVRKTYAEGFEPILAFPEERYVSAEDIHEAELSIRNEVGLLRVSSWQEYYRLRRIPLDSPLVLLLTFPATLYHAIVEYGTIPCTVAYTIMKRPLRIHIVGVEKELNFLDIFKEVSFLLPEDFVLELTFVVHHDMQPSSERNHASHGAAMVDNLTPSMRIVIAHGSYGDSLNPNFDCGSGRPDMIMAFNAGLFAYESWRSVVSYLDHHKDVVGVFTDYNEFSGVQCASLGGAKSRNSLTVNPFRQPRAMPVYCMNLPQFSNGFLYVFNEQSIE